MFFRLQQIIWLFMQPSNLFLLLVLLSFVLLFLRRLRSATLLLGVTLVLGFLPAVVPLHSMVSAPLENHFPIPDLPEQVDGIIVLGGTVETTLTAVRGQVTLGEGAERLTVSLWLAQRYPEATVVYTGGSGEILEVPMTEAGVAERFYADFGLTPPRLVLENRSRNTFENALFSRDIVAPQPGETWLLVTSARHMPRAVGLFRGVGWEVIPYPVDYRTRGDLRFDPNFVPLEQLVLADAAVKEWVSLVAYRLMGRIESFFPAY